MEAFQWGSSAALAACGSNFGCTRRSGFGLIMRADASNLLYLFFFRDLLIGRFKVFKTLNVTDFGPWPLAWVTIRSVSVNPETVRS